MSPSLATAAPRLPGPSGGRARAWITEDARYDVPASLIVFLVALPLSIGIAVASSAPVTAGLIAAVVGGLLAGILGGSPLTVTGPAAGLTIVVAGLIDQFGFAATGAITVTAGLLQVVLGASRVARGALAISPAVLHAMLAGIGVTIVLGQVHVLLGGSNQGEAVANLRALPEQIANVHGPALWLGLTVIAILVVWTRLPAPVRRVPGQLMAVVAVTGLSIMLPVDVARVELPGSLLSSIALPQIPSGGWGAIAIGVVTVTIIASVESLLSAVATDKLSADGRRANLDRELLGQGAANTASGLLGGLPVTGVIVRSSINIQAGARTRMSAILHSLWVLLFALVLVGVIELVPMAALAGLLVVLGVGLVKVNDIHGARRHGELAVYVITLLGVVFLNLLEGVAIGLTLAAVLVMRRAVWAGIRVEQGHTNGRQHWTVTIDGTLSFLSMPRLSHQLARVPPGADVTINLEADYLDHTAYDHLQGWRQLHELTGGPVRIDEIGSSRLATHDGQRADRGPVPRHFAPWSLWQSDDNAGRVLTDQITASRPDVAALASLLTGVHDYQTRSAPMMGQVMADLAEKQDPDVLFLTCADSRIVPNLITGSGPGDLFTVRNVGNLVPPSGDDSVRASIELAVEALGVRSIVVCGHSGCGAMKALLGGTADPRSALGRWLRAGDASLHAWRSGHPVGRVAAAAGVNDPDALAKVNIALQLERLEALPVVRDAVRAGRLQVAGLFYDVGSARVELLDRKTSTFGSPAAMLGGSACAAT
ncbi:MAG TPA: SulP family inorganic anion transporter [Solirubrobacteraceae bacterium]|nr:SulP family inorganic anion transporter [Solirubrobacteraceae bacterium]